MARLFTCGFEENDTTNTMWTSITGAPTIQGTTKHSGSYAMSTAGVGNSYMLKSLNAVPTSPLWTRFYFQADDATPSATTYIMKWLTSGNVLLASIQLDTSGVLILGNDVDVTTATGAVVLSDDAWYRIEHKVVISDTVGDHTVLLYNDAGALLETIPLGSADKDTLNGNYGQFRLGKTASTGQYFYDDLAINDASGTFQVSYPGAGKIYMLVPDSDVAITWEDSAGGTNNATFANIDGLPTAINDLDYNASDTLLDVADALGDTDRFGLTNLGAAVPSDATITLADVYGRIGSNQTAATHLRFQIWDEAGTLTDGPTCSANVNGFTITKTNEHLVLDTAGKTKANLDSFNAGYEPITDVLALKPRRVSELWVNVEWIEAGITAAQIVPAIQDSCEMIGMRNV